MAGLGILLFAASSFFFALAESALFSIGKWRLRQLSERAPDAGGQVAHLLEEPQDLLATIVLGNTLANAGLVATAVWLGLEGQWPIGPTLAGVLALVLLGCEVVPKTLAVRAPDLWSVRVVRPMLFLKRVTAPLRTIAQGLNTLLLRAAVPKSLKPQTTLTDEEYQELLELACQQGALGHSEKEIILQIINLDRRAARDAMRPRSEMACIPDDLPLEEMIAAARKYKHRRLPMYDETPDTIVGILNTRTLLLNPDGDLSEAIEFPSFVPESMNLLQLLKSFQRQQRGLAIVLDEFGGTAGLITVEDILEEVVGELHSEGEAQGFVMEKIAEGKWRVNGTMRLEDFRREYPALADVPGVDTMGGLLATELGVVPAPGESAVIGHLRLTALSGDERRVRELLVEDLRRRGGA